MSTDNFYGNLPAVHRLLDITDPRNFAPVPQDWYVLVTDIVNSTAAIAQGRYRDVNLLGASAIAAILNIAAKIDIPFVFGGDGAAILIPPALLVRSQQALLATHQVASDWFQLELRVGVVSVEQVRAAHYDINVAKLRVSRNYSQAVFTGGGLLYAAELLKQDERYRIDRHIVMPRASAANFSGLECRWQDIPSVHGQTLSLIVLATPRQQQRPEPIYRAAIERLLQIYGTEQDFHPAAPEALRLTFGYRKLMGEAKLRAQAGAVWLRLVRILTENLLGLILIRLGLKVGGTDWQQYPQDVLAASDYRKFDDVLRLVISSQDWQTQQLVAYLEQRSQQGELVYGLHISDRALMTCLVFERNGRQVHFIDGADGGYALAAKALKERMQRKALNWQSYMHLLRLRNRKNSV